MNIVDRSHRSYGRGECRLLSFYRIFHSRRLLRCDNSQRDSLIGET